MSTLARTVILRGREGENGPLYTRLLATDREGPHRGALFLTAEVYRDLDDGMPAFPIHRSDDGGRTWRHVTDLRDTALGMGHRHQPVIRELRVPFGGLPVGALLLAGNAIPADMSQTHLVLYSSVDAGATWQFHSRIDEGGPAVYDSSAESTTTAVWEPELDVIGDELVCYFADERWKADGMLQVIAMRSTKDLVNWSDLRLIKGVPDRSTRPGMFVSTGRMPDGIYRAVVEIVGPPEIPIGWLSSADGLDWGPSEDLGSRLTSTSGVSLVGTPNVAWRAAEDGGVIVLATGRMAIDADGRFVNAALVNRTGGNGPWYDLPLPTAAIRSMEDGSGYSQSLLWNATGEVVHATTVLNERGSHDIVVTVATWEE